jgi:hypothetical protein
LIDLIGFIQCCNLLHAPFSSSKGFFVGATFLVLQQQLLHVLHDLRSQAFARFD